MEDVLIGAKFVQAHRAAGVEAVGGDADLGAEAEFETVGKTGTGVVEDSGGINPGKELPSGFGIFGDDSIGMAGAAAVDPVDGGGGVRHNGDGKDLVVVFGGEVIVAGFYERQAGAVEEGFGSGVDTQFNAFFMQGFGQARELPGGFLMDEEVFRCVADAGTLGLGVDNNGFCLDGLGCSIDVDGADAGVVLDHGDTAVLDSEANEPLTAAGNDAVDGVVLFEKNIESGAVGGGDDLYGIRVDTGGLEGRLNDLGQLHVGVEGFLTAAKDGGIARLEAEDGTVDGDVRARFVDDANDAHGYADFAQVEAAGRCHAFDFFAHGVGQGGDLADAFGHLGDAFGSKGEALGHGAGESVLTGCFYVEGVGFEDGIGLGDEVVGQLLEELVFGRGREGGDFERGGAGALGDVADAGFDFFWVHDFSFEFLFGGVARRPRRVRCLVAGRRQIRGVRRSAHSRRASVGATNRRGSRQPRDRPHR